MVGGSTDLVVGVEAESMAAAEAGDGSTVGVMGAEVHGLTASRHLYQRTPSSGSLDSPPGCGNVLKTRTLEPGLQPAKILAFELENTDAHLQCRSLSTIRISQKCEVSVVPTLIIPATCRPTEGLNSL